MSGPLVLHKFPNDGEHGMKCDPGCNCNALQDAGSELF